VERRLTGDQGYHNVLDRPRDMPSRTAFGAALLTLVLVVFFAGSADRVLVTFGVDYAFQIWLYRVLAVLGPPIVFFLVRQICRELRRDDEIEHERELAETEARAAET
jgi:ubiquinol-cytochrome c reductase cytochrome b subunit